MDIAAGAATLGTAVQRVWLTDGVSEFASALLGGAFALVAQQLAIRHDRKCNAAIALTESKGTAWAIYFKISAAHEALTAALSLIREAEKKAAEQGLELWQVLQFPPHDWKVTSWETAELVYLLDQRQFQLMQSYQECTWWLSNLVQSTQLYREMRVEFLRGQPSTISGDVGSMSIESQAALEAIMPTIVHLRTLADSLAQVVSAQQPDARRLLVAYAEAMKVMIGSSPSIEFMD